MGKSQRVPLQGVPKKGKGFVNFMKISLALVLAVLLSGCACIEEGHALRCLPRLETSLQDPTPEMIRAASTGKLNTLTPKEQIFYRCWEKRAGKLYGIDWS